MAELWIPPSTERSVPEWFSKSLHSIDPRLIVYFNPLRKRWVIDRCIRQSVLADHKHDSMCSKTNVKVVQGENGEYMPLCDQVLDWFRGNDIGCQFNSPDAFVDHLTRIEREAAAKLKEERRQNTVNNRKDHRVQLNKFKMLVDRHDVARPHK